MMVMLLKYEIHRSRENNLLIFCKGETVLVRREPENQVR